MRITGGALCGRLVETPAGVIRPAMDRMRESVFASLGDLTSASFLDLFSGSGCIALEASSRGASFVVSVENDKLKHPTLLKNISISENAGLSRIICKFMSVELYVKRAKERDFDIIFCDPPFNYGYKSALITDITRSPLLKASSLLLLHHPRGERLEAPPALSLLKRKEYGRSVVDFYEKNAAADAAAQGAAA